MRSSAPRRSGNGNAERRSFDPACNHPVTLRYGRRRILGAVDFLRSVRAEWLLLRIRLLRTRLGFWLALVVAAALWLERTVPAPDSLATMLRAGALAAVLSIGYLAGSGSDRRALALPLLHGATPGAVALGRWCAATGGAALVVLAVAAHDAWTTGAVSASLGGALAGLATAAAVGACTLALVWCGGNILAGLFFVWLALVGASPPEALIGARHPGLARWMVAGVLELAPAPWRYRGIATGDPGSWAHAAMWVGLGLLLARWRVGRLAARMR
jgi:hypothetical protein